MRKSKFAAVSIAFVVAGSGGCNSGGESPKEEPAKELGRATSPIINGIASTSDQDAVVLLVLRVRGQGVGQCTGTLVAPKLVVTARHCVAEIEDGDGACSASGNPVGGGTPTAIDFAAADIDVYTGTQATRFTSSTSKAAAHGKQLVHEGRSTLCNSDVAFIVLDRSVQGRIAPMRLKTPPVLGEKLTAVGWGLTEDGTLPRERVQRSGIAVTKVGPFVQDLQSGIGIGPSELMAGESTCSGDSGGPTFSSKGALVGIVSRGSNGQEPTPASPAAHCLGPNVVKIFTHLSQKSALVTKAFSLAGAEPRIEGDAVASGVGEPCKLDYDCSSNACIEGKCERRCDDGTTCADDEECSSVKNKKICAPKPPEPPPVKQPAPPVVPDAGAAAAAPASSESGGCSAGAKSPNAAGASGVMTILAAIAAHALASRRRRRRRRTA